MSSEMKKTTKVIEIELREPEPVAWLYDGIDMYEMNKKEVKERIKLRKENMQDITGEEKALKTLLEAEEFIRLNK